jgi:hypothetical protein
VRVLPDPDRAADKACWIGLGLERVVGQEAGLVFVGTVIAGTGGDGPKPFDRGDERETTLFRIVLMEDEGVDLASAGRLVMGVSSGRLGVGGMVRPCE